MMKRSLRINGVVIYCYDVIIANKDNINEN